MAERIVKRIYSLQAGTPKGPTAILKRRVAAYARVSTVSDEQLKQRDDMKEKGIIFGGILFELKELDELPITFKDSLWHTLADHVTIYGDERIVFAFKDGTEIVTML